MKTPCCVESGKVCPKTSSCSMILRSSCSHGHSHKSVMVNDVQVQRETLLKRTSDEKVLSNSKQLEDSLYSKEDPCFDVSLEELHFTSGSCTDFKVINCKSFQLSQYHREHFKENEKNSMFIDQFHIGQTSTPIYNLNSNDSNLDKVGLKSTSIEQDCKVLGSSSTMSTGRRLQRSNLRALSGDEDDESFLESQVNRRRTRSSQNNITSNSHSVASSSSHSIVNSHNSSNHARSSYGASLSKYSTNTPSNLYIRNRSFSSPEASEVDISSVQFSDSTIGKMRWILWRYVYLQLVSSVSFDAWLLSRIHDKKYKILLLMLLPLLAFLIYHTLDMGVVTKSLDFVSSTALSFASSLYSLLISPFIYSKKIDREDHDQISTCSAYLPSASGILSFFPNLFVKTDESYTITHKNSESSDRTNQHINYSPSKEELKSLAIEMLDERFKVLITHFYKTKIVQENLKTKQETTREFQKEISGLHTQFQSLVDSLKQVEKNVKQVEGSAVSAKNFENFSKEQSQHFKLLNEKVKAFEIKLESLNTVKKCCDEKMAPSDFVALFEKHIVTAFKNVVDGGKNPKSPYYFFNEWLNSKLTDSKKLSSEINVAFEKLKTQLKPEARQDKESLKVIEDIVKHYVESLKTNLSLVGGSRSSLDDSFSVLNMRKIAEEAIMLYDADKTGKVDYALESAGGSVLGTRCSESYTEKEGKLYLLGLPWWSDQNSPRTAIQPNVQPGECWAFKGSQGFLVIQLSYTIYPTGFTMEHIPLSLSPTGSLDSAPKDFSVWGLASENDIDGTLLGSYSFDQEGGPLQYFPVQNLTPFPVSYVELKIHSNHGNLEYTCLYRFRVHGTREK